MKIMYIRDENRNPVGVLVYERNKEENSVKYQYSVCAPSDKFDKEKGLRVAKIRLQEVPIHVVELIKPIETTHHALEIIMTDISVYSKSHQARSFARYWILRNTDWLWDSHKKN